VTGPAELPEPAEDETGMEPIRVVIADDHPVFRDGLHMLLRNADGIDVVAAVADGQQAITAAADLQPDVVVMDLHMPGTNGIDATRRITTASPHIGVLVLTMLEDDESVFAAMRAGARGYLLKDADQEDIAHAVTSLAHGVAVFGPSIAQRIIDYFAAQTRGTNTGAFPDLTDREREILDLVAQGLNNTTIARRLFLSPKTIRNHISNIFSKLQVADRADAIVRARRAGLGGD
jgi:DNA-binding NarL/FixJ family response regulator